MDIAKILKDCPKGTKLYSPLCGECYFDGINYGTIICKKQNSQEITFTSEGYYMLPVFDDAEPILFPSKDQRNWGEFQKPIEPKFKVGDKIVKKNNTTVSLIITGVGDEFYYSTTLSNVNLLPIEDQDDWELAVEPKFKVGDKIKHKVNKTSPFTITEITDTSYKGGYRYEVLIEQQDNFELVPNKFDITTLKPFESKVLVRDNYGFIWKPAVFGFYYQEALNKFVSIGGISWGQCIPYEGNEHLLGTTDDCDNFYKTWE